MAHLAYETDLLMCRMLCRQSWLDGGIIAALVDCASALPNASSLQQQRPSQQQPQRSSCSDISAAAEALRSISECASLVLLHAEQHAAVQVQLLLDCIARSLWGTQAQALNAVQLLHSLLQEPTESASELGQLMQEVREVYKQQRQACAPDVQLKYYRHSCVRMRWP
jgi:hypothetical protein